ncbi:Hpt domain-containing protein [Bacilliculturomica massiliensis]|uniref:Hpt domain-containing protein n=1 Tax=Bacilliculturomica massiliensis TaxID=1917867 RepID=UPI001032229C|nr:Hpt domain-containing protein [Bacilliculturomica massiliensis]
MTIQECYRCLGEDYAGALDRLVTAERVEKFFKRLSKDQNFSLLCQAIEEENAEGAFCAAHSLKGLAMFLGLEELSGAASALTESLRDGQITQEAGAFLVDVCEAYEKVLKVIDTFYD